MKSKQLFVFITACVLYNGTIKAQVYTIKTDKYDQFSIAFVELLNCAVKKFSDCKGAFLQYTMMQQTESALTIAFPNSIAGIVRSRDWENDAYVEFGPYADRQELVVAIQSLKQKIQHALGNNLYKDGRADNLLNFSMNIADEKGFFQSNFELLTGTTTEKSYLLTPSTHIKETGQREHHFILLKVQSGKPDYYYYVPHKMDVPDTGLQQVLRRMIAAADSDFDSLSKEKGLRKKISEKVEIDGQAVIIERMGGNRSANIYIEAAADSIEFEKQWQYYQKVMQAAAGERYVFTETKNFSYGPYVVYFNKLYDNTLPDMYLQVSNWKTKEQLIVLKVQSRFVHPVKRSANFTEWEGY